ncbi:beta-mannosidase [Fictibacillus enclensis]|uniref:Beta-mannosidase B n=1 Tax=Fictibacillus enclensis TaxID=1017270 RepID=A0A0V8IZV0_9BACL|nr:glycoside hydrolase family 2 protein [Fictibacillus enclensis]KSU80276.1 beta-galactosidase [Fictibacillus enclensis]SCC37463.1 beta-mannosidase [Fictibacillus enclensis]
MTQELSFNATSTKSTLQLKDWKFKACDEQNWLSAEVPGCVHTDLLKNRLISDPFYGKNELQLQWIDKKDWEYETTFDVPHTMLSLDRLELLFHGLDTYGDVYLNDTQILKTDNMFRVWKKDVKEHLKEQNNVLRIRFCSPIEKDLVKQEKLGYNLPAVNDHSEDGEVGDKTLSVFARKAPYHYGWDWGPRFVTSGIWKSVELAGWSTAEISDLFIQQKKVTSSSAELTAVVEIETEKEAEGILHIEAEGVSISQDVRLAVGTNTVEIELKITNPKLWWSRGLGEPHLYDFTASYVQEEQMITEKTVRTGLRSITLVREKDEQGASFYFELNGVPVFAKGANHIPNDSFVTEVTYERYKHEIISAELANMNMLRVWGGGIYENDEFYELCDQHGILVWQDFMFACSMYPGDQAFMDNVKAEAEDNIRRLRNHPCIALWCGNNEMDVAWAQYDEEAGWGWKQQYSQEQRDEIWQAYDTLFHHLLPEAVQRLSPEIAYWPSSPMADWSNDRQQHSNYVSGSGDIHYWDVWHGSKPFEEYNSHVGRFMSEYGFQSFPEYKNVKQYAEDEDMELESEVMLHHQKNGRGNALIKEYMEKYLPVAKDFPSFLYMSHVLQAEGIKSAIEAHRRKKPYCMGTLYWQMNDCWPVASWASMDYYGRWKALHYYAKKSFQDVMVSIDGTNSEKVDVHVISDQLDPVEGTLISRLLNFQGEVIREFKDAVNLDKNTGNVILSLSTAELLDGQDPAGTVFQAELVADERVIDCKEHYFVSGKELKLKIPVLSITRVSDSEYMIETNTLAKQVWLSTDTEGVFSDNYFDLIPGSPKRIQFFERKEGALVFGSPENLEVQSMYDFMKR